ncbi:hypothetical protein ACVIHI_008883 [Bradyrhizobium sp. USDA 4524]|nr:hypothetical protein [Bradyrhizobium sp. USDA 4538]MCP1907028.1 hypothetical protein [Bradyrhizobium sp. USDA 4537]MCP1985504.1 hypothetical protein [Bradyrhizobium sp. USDA 4539]
MAFRYSAVGIVVGSIAVICSGFSRAEDSSGIGWPSPSKRAYISGHFHDDFISLGVSSRTAGAIHSLMWRGVQFVNSNDHGREIQSATFFDDRGECLNPTEAGAARDGTGERSTSKLLSLSVQKSQLTTVTQMAYWLGPGERSENCKSSASIVTSKLSNDILTKTVTIGVGDIANAISYETTFHVAENHSSGGFEALTAYMPPEFNNVWTFNPATSELRLEQVGQGDDALPVIFSTADRNYAIGVYSPAEERSAYGRWKFLERGMSAPTTKMNCYFRKAPVARGDHSFKCYIVLGSLEDVRSGIRSLCSRSGVRTCSER